MKLPDIRYRRAEDLAHAVELLADDPDDSRILAGGQSLVPVMALRLAHPSTLVDITHCPDVQTWAFYDDDLVISAAVTARRVECNPEVAEGHPLLKATLGHVGHAEIRNRGTICGSAAHADPAAEVPALLLGLEGSVRVIGPRGRRRVAAQDFFTGPYMTSLNTDEVVAGVELPLLPSSSGWSVKEVVRRHGDFALVGVICVITLDPHTAVCARASLTLFGVAATAHRCSEAERFLVGQALEEPTITQAALMAFKAVEVMGDIHGSAEYRIRAGTVLVKRALNEAHAMAEREMVIEEVVW